jgi:hypothetical protein
LFGTGRNSGVGLGREKGEASSSPDGAGFRRPLRDNMMEASEVCQNFQNLWFEIKQNARRMQEARDSAVGRWLSQVVWIAQAGSGCDITTSGLQGRTDDRNATAGRKSFAFQITPQLDKQLREGQICLRVPRWGDGEEPQVGPTQRPKLLGNPQLQKSVTTLFGQADTLLHVSFVP